MTSTKYNFCWIRIFDKVINGRKFRMCVYEFKDTAGPPISATGSFRNTGLKDNRTKMYIPHSSAQHHVVQVRVVGHFLCPKVASYTFYRFVYHFGSKGSGF